MCHFKSERNSSSANQETVTYIMEASSRQVSP